MNKEKTIYTIGHSTHNLSDFIEMLKSFKIKILADVRSFPQSRRHPQFNKESLALELAKHKIKYVHLSGLGGRRRVKQNSKNSRWRNDSFRGYADYMESSEFENAAAELESLASKETTAYMCAEALWWRCHRSMISDYLKARGWNVQHITSSGKSEEHHYTSPAIINDNRVYYSEDQLFDE